MKNPVHESLSFPRKLLRHFSRSVSLIAFTSAFLILGLSSFLIYNAYEMSIRSHALRMTSDALSLNSQTSKLILDSETGPRSYLLTGNKVFLEPFEESLDQIPISLEQLKESVASDPIELLKYARTDADRSAKNVLLLGSFFSFALAIALAFFLRRHLLAQFRRTLQAGQSADALFQQLRTIADAAPVAIIYIDREGRYTFSNRYYSEHFGRQAVVGKTVHEVIGVRDICRKTGKSIDIVFEGEDTEIDKGIADQISEPLIHLVRNAVDHGIEPAEDRKKLGKSETGTLKMKAFQQGNFMVIEVTDDGAGIDIEKIKKSSLKNLC